MIQLIRSLHLRGFPTVRGSARFLAVAVLSLVLAGVTTVSALDAQTAAARDGYISLPEAVKVVPFSVGEKLEYEVRFGAIKVGSGRMEVRGVSDVRGRPAYHAIFQYGGSVAFYKVKDMHQSWFDVQTLTSLRFWQDIDEGSYERTRRFEIFPERGMYRENDKPEEPTVAEPLDDASFLYFIRTLPLKVGETYTFQRYFKAQGNPVRIRVLRRETVKVPAGTFNAVVLQPTFQTRGIFSENGKAEVWISDDSARVMVQMKSKLSIGSLNLYLKAHNTKAGTP